MSLDPSHVLVVDLAGVLFRFDHPHRLKVLGRLLGREPAEVDELLWGSGFSADCDAGRYPTAASARRQLRRLTGYDGSDADLDAAWCSAYTVDAEVGRLLGAARVRLVLLTNNGPLEEDVLPRTHPEAFTAFERLFFAYALAGNKPDQARYAQVARLLDVAPERLCLVDDSDSNVEGARAAGWQAVTFDGPGDLAALLDR